MNHGVVDLRLVEEFSELIVVVFPNDVNVVLAVDVKGWPIAILRASFNDGVINGRDGPVVRSRTVHRRSPWIKYGIHNGVLARFVSPYEVDSVEFVNLHVWVPDLVKAGVGDLCGVDERLPTWREHRVVEVLIVASPYDVDVS